MSTFSFRAPYRWLGEAGALLRRNPGAIVGGSGLLLAIALLPSVLQLLLQRAAPGAGGSAASVVFSLLGLVLMPPALGGFFRLIQSVDRGTAAAPSQVTAMFRDGPVALRLIACNALFALLTLAVLAGLVALVGSDELLGYVRQLASIKPNATPADVPEMPPGTLPLVGLMLLVALFVTTAQQLAAAQIALAARPMLAASGDGVAATLRHAVALLLFFLPVLLVATLMTLVAALVASVIVLALGMLSQLLATLALVVVALLVLVPMYALLLAFFYCAWRELFSGGRRESDRVAPPPHEIAV
jgi:hypothetical protein